MRFVKALWPLFAVAIVGLLIMILAEPVSKWIAANRAAHNGNIIGYVVKAEGSVRRIHGADVELIASPVVKKVELRDGDRLQTSLDSRAIFTLNSQDEFEVGSGGILQFQLWNPADANSPIYINWSLGPLTLKKGGVRGKAYVVKEGRLYLPGQKPLAKAMALTVLKNAPLDLHLADQGGKPGADFETDNTPSEDSSANPPPANAANPDTLSNEYIDETVVAHQAQLQKCWLSRLKDVKAEKGQIVVQFEISKRGKVRDARVADSNFKDDVLQTCVVSVFERMQFRPFKGAEISLSYPVNFE